MLSQGLSNLEIIFRLNSALKQQWEVDKKVRQKPNSNFSFPILNYRQVNQTKASQLGRGLNSFSIYKCPVEDWHRTLTQLSKNKHLSQLTILHCQLSVDRNLDAIASFKNLRTLQLQSCRIGPDGAREMTKIKSIRQLSLNNLGDNMLGDEGAKYISFIDCYFLRIGDNNIGKQGAYWISKMPSVKRLDLCPNPITIKGMTYISFMSNLIELAIQRNAAFTQIILSRMKKVRFNEWTTFIVMQYSDQQ